MVSFIRKVSKGSKFNQIYVPKEMENIIDVGDLVQVNLLEKKSNIYYKNQGKLTKFKEYLIKNIFYNLKKFKEIEIVFLVGSFLDEDIYNDIDLIIVSKEYVRHLEKSIEYNLSKILNQKFHILSFNHKKLKELIEKDPIMRAMFQKYISNKKISLDYKKIIDWSHIKFLLMMPEDLLELDLPIKIFFDNIRRLITIERFLHNKDLSRKVILEEMKRNIPQDILDKIKDNKYINNIEIIRLKRIIKEKLIRIKSFGHGKK